MTVTKLTSDNSEEFLEANKDSYSVLVFNADFTDQEDIVKAAVKALDKSKELKDKIVLASVDVEQNNDLATKLSVLSVPIVVCMMGGEVLKKIDTLDPEKLINIVSEDLKRLAIASGESNEQTLNPKERLEAYLKELINRDNVMIFMKGNPTQPRCGFSKQLVEILAKHKVKYNTFDILQDEDVRQGMKEYSEWPTYPQIYVKGEFVGGLDILKQLEESGELSATFNV